LKSHFEAASQEVAEREPLPVHFGIGRNLAPALNDARYVLCVDDDSTLLEGVAATLRKDFNITIALGAEDAFGAMQTFGPPTVLVTDMRMPGMDGGAFLSRVRRMYPDTVRILLTGQADLADAARAVNEGEVFRILTKPCSHNNLRSTISEAMDHAEEVALECVSAHQKIEKQSEAASARSEAMLRLGTLAAGIAHELNNFVPALRAAAARLDQCIRTGVPPEVGTVRMVDRISGQVAAHAQHLFGLGRFRAGQRERTDLCAITRETASLVRKGRFSSDVRVLFDLPRHPMFVDMPRASLEQILVNLLHNATEAVQSVADRDPRIRIKVISRASHVALEMADNGRGIPRAALGRVFEPYFTTKAPGRGCGLGLTVVKGLIEGHGGTVTVDSVEGVGTTVRLEIPTSRQRAGAEGST
jgi:C4-dicarboxylate-specific signal transduction histidine kinase